jgi:arsenate reductase
MKQKILFVCIHNSARSQMAEAFINHLCGDEFEAESAGLEPGKLNPFVVQAMAEAGINISRNATKSVFDMHKQGRIYRYVVTVCDEASAEKCPIFPGIAERLHWGFSDPSAEKGSDAAKLEKARAVRDQINARVEQWCEEFCTAPA